ncbi:MAG: YvrJ family protein [bacterium]|jgi:hypothetical protein
MESLLTQVGNFGFPMVLSIYLLVRIEGKLDRLTESIYQLSHTLEAVKNISR